MTMQPPEPALSPVWSPDDCAPGHTLEPTPATGVVGAEAAACRAVEGELWLRFRPVTRGQACMTVVDTLVQTPPLRIVRPFTLPDGAALVHLHNLSGGILGGDSLRTTVDVAAGARAQLTTTGATRIYRRRHDRGPAQQECTFHVGAGALLEYLPDPVIPYAGSAYRQRTHFTLAPGAGLFAWELITPGREAHGECFDYAELAWESAVAVSGEAPPLLARAGRSAVQPVPIAIERVRLEPARRPLTATARLGPFRYMATLLACRVGASVTAWPAVEQALAGVAAELAQEEGCWWGVSTLSAHGVIVRGLGVSGRALLAALPVFWRRAKELIYGEAALLPRKIY